jgi:hypothetical protein
MASQLALAKLNGHLQSFSNEQTKANLMDTGGVIATSHYHLDAIEASVVYLVINTKLGRTLKSAIEGVIFKSRPGGQAGHHHLAV